MGGREGEERGCPIRKAKQDKVGYLCYDNYSKTPHQSDLFLKGLRGKLSFCVGVKTNFQLETLSIYRSPPKDVRGLPPATKIVRFGSAFSPSESVP